MKSNTPPRLRIVQVNLQSDRGGDGRMVSQLHEQYRALGYPASLLVGRGDVVAEGERLLRNDDYRSWWARHWLAQAKRLPAQPGSGVAKLARWIAEPARRWRIRRGFEDFDFPGTLPSIAALARGGDAILHLHNLHGGYFDLRTMPALSEHVPIVLTLHDQWTFTGHCAHSFECERWTLGCGDCPDLTTYPAIPKDRTAKNFSLKKQVFAQSQLHLTTPSEWLMEKAKQSLLAPAIAASRVIPNGVDAGIFHPGDRAIERSRLGLPADARVMLCVGSMVRPGHWMDQRLLELTLHHIRESGRANFILLILGAARRSQSSVPGIRVEHRPYERDASKVASYMRASDIYIHPSRADTFPTRVLESLACGVPVVATDVGGIPEQVSSLWATRSAGSSSLDSASGILVGAEDSTGMGRAVVLLADQDQLRIRLGENGAHAAATKFSIILQAERYLAWYREVLAKRRRGALSAPA